MASIQVGMNPWGIFKMCIFSSNQIIARTGKKCANRAFLLVSNSQKGSLKVRMITVVVLRPCSVTLMTKRSVLDVAKALLA